GAASVPNAFRCSSQCIHSCRSRPCYGSLEKIFTSRRNPYRSFVHWPVSKRSHSNVSEPQGRLLLLCRWQLTSQLKEVRRYLPCLPMQRNPFRGWKTQPPLWKFSLLTVLTACHPLSRGILRES